MLYSYFDYLEKVEQIQDEFDQSLILNVANHIDALQEYSFIGLPVIFILDYRRRSYIFFSASVKTALGFDYRDFIEGGLPFSLNIQKPCDLEVFSKKIFKENSRFLTRIPYLDHNKYVFCHNYRVKNKKGQYTYLKQQSIFLKSTPEGLPVYNMGLLLDIGETRSDSLIVHEIKKNDGQNPHSFNKPVVANYFYPETEQPLLSRRECEVIKWVASGYSSKQIADKMNISLHTVKRHRSNILIKTNCRNSAELVNYALNENIL